MSKKYWKKLLAAACAGAIILTSVSGYAAEAGENDTEAAVSRDTEPAEDTGAEGNQSQKENTADEADDNSAAEGADEEKSGQGSQTEVTKEESKEENKDETKADKEKETSGTEEETMLEGVPVDKQGLPTRGLLINLVEDDANDEGTTKPELFVKLNPCGKKEHNSQPSDYMSSALGCAEFVFERTKGDTSWHMVDEINHRENGSTSIGFKDNSYMKRIVESYADTNDLWHCFLIGPASADTERVYAFIPLQVDEKNRRFADASDQYCFRYEAALSDEQNWEMTDGRKISGGYIVKGEGEKEHAGRQMEYRTIHLRKKTGGKEFTLKWPRTYKSLPDTGLQISVDSLPEHGIQGSLILHLTCPDTFQNGEGGFGFSHLSSYRKQDQQKWMYQITGKGGMKVLIQRFRKTKNGAGYNLLTSKKADVTNDGVNVDLTDLGIDQGDVILVRPYVLDWEKMTDPLEFTDKSVRPIRFFHFQYSLSCDTGTISVEGKDGTKVQSTDEQHVAGKDPVSDDGKFFQKISVSVEETEESKNQCGWLDKAGIANYGFVLRKGADDWSLTAPDVTVIPQKEPGENYVWYTAQWYKEENGTYELLHTELAKISTRAALNWNNVNGQNADICVIRRIRYNRPDHVITENVFMDDDTHGKSEMTDADKKVRYPQTGKDIWQVYPSASRGADSNGKVRLCKCSVWKSTDPEKWKKDADREEGTEQESVLRGFCFQTDLSKNDEKGVAVETEKTDERVSVNQAFDQANGLPAHSLVIMNHTKGDIKGNGVEYRVNLEVPVGRKGFSRRTEDSSTDGKKTTVYSRIDDGQAADCHLYRRKEDGTWEKIEQNDAADWVNSGTSKFYRINLSDNYAYGVHAHLKENEAIVISPQIDFYDINYSVDMYSHDDYDVLADECTLPDDCVHLTRHYFQGRLFNEKRSSEGKTTMLTITTSPKGEDTKDTEKASPLTGQSVRPLKVNLFDYDFGNEHTFVLGDQTQTFRFRYDPKNVSDADVNMWHRGTYSGILKNRLAEDGNPVFNYSTPFDEKGTGLFDLSEVSEKVNGGTKQVYPNVDFDFIYNAEEESYSYNSAVNAACFDETANHVYEYDHTLGIDGWDAKGAGFFPFNNFGQKGVWGTKDKKNKGTYLIDQKTGMDYHFGMSTTQTFQIPEDGKVKNKNLQFHFSGDDDAWVFIDGQLVLDMGGIHEAVQGGIDFTNGTWYISADQNSPWDTFGSDSYTAPIVTSGRLADKIADFPGGTEGIGKETGAWAKGTSHTFSFFYLERGGTLSDLSMNFNLPSVKPVPEEPKESFVFTGDSGICKMQVLGMAFLLLGAGIWMKRRHEANA